MPPVWDGEIQFWPPENEAFESFPQLQKGRDDPNIIRVNYLIILQTHREWVGEKRFAIVMAQWTLHGRIKGVTGTAVLK